MANGQNNPDNPFVKKGEQKGEPKPTGDRNRMLIEPADSPVPEAQYSDRIKQSPIDEQGRATKRALKGWPEGLKKA